MESTQMTQPQKIQASFEVEKNQLLKLKKLAKDHERSYGYVLRKLIEQANAKGTFEFVEPQPKQRKPGF